MTASSASAAGQSVAPAAARAHDAVCRRRTAPIPRRGWRRAGRRDRRAVWTSWRGFYSTARGFVIRRSAIPRPATRRPSVDALEQRARARQRVALPRLDRDFEPVAPHVDQRLVDDDVGARQSRAEIGDAGEGRLLALCDERSAAARSRPVRSRRGLPAAAVFTLTAVGASSAVDERSQSSEQRAAVAPRTASSSLVRRTGALALKPGIGLRHVPRVLGAARVR